MVYLIRPIVLFMLGFGLAQGAVALAKHLDTKPKVSPVSIPYCWAKDHGMYLPCMYSSKEYAA